MKRQVTNSKMVRKPDASIKKGKTLSSYDEVFNQLYNYGFKKIYIKSLLATVSTYTWNFYNQHYTSDHVIDDIVKDISSQNIEGITNNMRKQSRILFTKMLMGLESHYNTNHLLQIIIEYGNGRYNAISPHIFLYKIDTTNEWFNYHNQDKEYEYYNAEEYEDVVKAVSLLKTNNTLYYHATNWKSVQDILEDGPDNREGRQCLDFGRTPSFYVTPDINTAIEWCGKLRLMFQKECGIVIFSLPNNTLETRDDYKIFEEPNNEWKHLVKDSRTCKKKNMLDDMNFVYGPMLENAQDIRTDGVEVRAHNPIKWQLASKSRESDKILKRSMLGAIFIRKSCRV